MKILAIETSQSACSVALLVDDQCCERTDSQARQHAQRVLEMVDALLDETNLTLSQLDAIAFNQGPGSFTGIRIGTAIAQGLAFSQALPLIPVSSFDVLRNLASEKFSYQNIAIAIDARMQEVYFSAYECQQGIWNIVSEPCVVPPASIELDQSKKWLALGNGWAAYRDQFSQSVKAVCTETIDNLHPEASAVARLAKEEAEGGLKRFTSDLAEPLYLRNKVV
ncbi:MAG: tRNA (adenosine(37)-N6)-threonylcarbamoyltransferase complex dimerization subunit type 1 TsaB [Gammaproteobacteria bacterium]